MYIYIYIYIYIHIYIPYIYTHIYIYILFSWHTPNVDLKKSIDVPGLGRKKKVQPGQIPTHLADSTPSFHTFCSKFPTNFACSKKFPNFPCSKSGEICSKIFHVPNLATVLWYFFHIFSTHFLFVFPFFHQCSLYKMHQFDKFPNHFSQHYFSQTKITAHFPICFQCSWDVFPKTIVSVSHSNDNTDNAETN